MKSTDPTPDQFAPLPVLHGSGAHVELKPTIVIDTREQAPLRFARLLAITGTLQSGDYSFVGGGEMFTVERKSIPDLVACCVGENRARFERELHRLRGHQFKRLLIVGQREDIEEHRYRSNVSPASVLGSLATWEIRYDVPIVWAGDAETAARLVESWVHYAAREIIKATNEFLKAGEQLKLASN